VSRAVEWSFSARRALAQIVRFIAEIDPTAVGLAALSPCRPGRVAGAFAKPVVGLPYISADARDDRDDRRVLAIRHVDHAARDWPPGDWPRD